MQECGAIVHSGARDGALQDHSLDCYIAHVSVTDDQMLSQVRCHDLTGSACCVARRGGVAVLACV